MIVEKSLTAAQRGDLAVIAGMMIPESAEYKVPGADDRAIQADILATLSRDTEQVAAALDHIARLAGRPLADLDETGREAVVTEFRRCGGAPAATLARVILQCYYRDDRVLRSLGLVFDVCPADLDERPLPGQPPASYALATALAKAQMAVERCGIDKVVLGADTDVAIDGQILGKPRDRDDALAMLMRLSGRWHEVHSAVALIHQERFDAVQTMTRVRFGEISAAEAEAYWATGEPADKAGAYAIQGHAARWVREIAGSYTGVVGLPLYETCHLLARFGVATPCAPAAP